MVDFDFKKTLSSRGYTLMVCHRWKKIDKELFGSKDFTKRTVERLQESENSRMAMHKSAMEELTTIESFTEKEAHKMLQDECERLIKEKFRDLKDDENFCGCCRVIIKTKDMEKHEEENKLLHQYLNKELMTLNREQCMMRSSIAKNKAKEDANCVKSEVKQDE